MKRQMLSLFLTFLILMSVGGVVSIVGAAPVSKKMINTDSSFATDIRSKEQPVLALLLSSNVTNVDESVDLFGGLATFQGNNMNNIEGATIHIEKLDYYGTTWNHVSDVTTMSGKFSGFFTIKTTPRDPGAYVYRATYDGDSQYAPAISHWVALRVYS
jgi:hypothetical protein